VTAVGDRDRQVVERYFQAMRAGAAGGEEMMSLFLPDAVYVEPFTGESKTHVGKDAIRSNVLASQNQAPPDMQLILDRLDISEGRIRSEWTCTSPAFPRLVHGQDLWTIRAGKIARLETSILR
jgi:hypothetical protein